MIYHGDLFDVLPTLEANSIDAVVTDPPYGISFMGKDWDNFRRANNADDVGRDSVMGRLSRTSPASGTEANRAQFHDWTEAWAREVLRVLKPGGHLIAFGGTRTFHRLTCGLEDAGFEIRDCLSWLYGSGFPKSLDVSKAIDKAAGAVREVVGKYELPDVADGRRGKGWECTNTTDAGIFGVSGQMPITAPSTDAAKQWAGWGTALKPSWEPAILARKPLVGTVAANVLAHGTGAINVDACRIETSEDLNGGAYTDGREPRAMAPGGDFRSAQPSGPFVQPLGRWPANVLLDEDVAEMLDAMSGALHDAGPEQGGGSARNGSSSMFGIGNATADQVRFGDSGGASRFFYVAKPSRAERDKGTHGLQARQRDESRKDGNPGGDNPRNRGLQQRGNHHPTVKPVELMRYLVRLVTPKDGIVLDPFTGSGTTGMACAFEGLRFIGIEREAEYVAIAERRIADCLPLFGEPA